jgi:hypothetical protein
MTKPLTAPVLLRLGLGRADKHVSDASGTGCSGSTNGLWLFEWFHIGVLS